MRPFLLEEGLRRNRYNRPLIIAHRGYSTKCPENTLVAFKAAMDVGVQMIELDVMLSKDRKVVVIHDATLERTTNGSGSVGDYTLAELKRLDAGSWFDPLFTDERLPTLEEVLGILNGRTALNIEIKRDAYEPHNPPDAIERQVVEMVRERGLLHSVLISSFEWKVLENIAAMEDAPAIALLSRYPDEDHHLEFSQKLNAFSWHPRCQELKHEHVREIHQAGLLVFPYNVETQEDYGQMVEMQVDGVITSDPLISQGWSQGRGGKGGR